MKCFRQESTVNDKEFLISTFAKETSKNKPKIFSYAGKSKNEEIKRVPNPIAEENKEQIKEKKKALFDLMEEINNSEIECRIQDNKISSSAYRDIFTRSAILDNLNKSTNKKLSVRNEKFNNHSFSSNNLSFEENLQKSPIRSSDESRFLVFERIKKNDDSFDLILTRKLIWSMEEQNNNSKFMELDELKIPFPKDDNKIEDMDYIRNQIEEINLNLKDKYLISKFHVDISTIAKVDYFMENAFQDRCPKSYSRLDKIKNKNYIGVNFKKDNKGQYVIYFLYAIEV